MKRLIGISLGVALSLGGCKKESAPEQPEQPAQEKPAAPAQPQPAPAAAAPQKTSITDASVTKFTAYAKARNADLRTGVDKLREQAKALKGKQGLDAAQAYKKLADQFTDEQAALEKKERDAQGLSEEDVKTLHDAATEVYAARKGADSLAKMLGNAPVGSPQHEQLQKQVDEMKQAADARKTYGDAAVDALVKHEAELAPLVDQNMKLGLDALTAAGGQ